MYGKKSANKSGTVNRPSWRLTSGQMGALFQIYHSLALAAENLADPVVIVSTTKLKELLFAIPGSDSCNPLRDVSAEQVTDWDALR